MVERKLIKNSEIEELTALLDCDLGELKETVVDMMRQINILTETIQEMQLDSEAEACDYYEKREDIEGWLHQLLMQEGNLKLLKEEHDKKYKVIMKLKNEAEDEDDPASLDRIGDKLNKEKDSLDKDLKKADKADDAVEKVKKDMDDCNIPANIKLRAKELNQLKSQLGRFNNNWEGLKSVGDLMDNDMKAKFNAIRKDLDKEGKNYDGLKGKQTEFEGLTMTQIYGDGNDKIVKGIREHKEKIKLLKENALPIGERLKDLTAQVNKLSAGKKAALMKEIQDNIAILNIDLATLKTATTAGPD